MEDLNSPTLDEATPVPTVGSGGGSSTDILKLGSDSSHPFFLHSSDAPGMMLVHSPFTGQGFARWRRGFLIALSTKNKLGFIDGSICEPKISSESYKPWSRCNDMVISWLLNALSREIAESVLYSKTARDIWIELEERFGQTNGPQLYQLQKQISELTQDFKFTKSKKFGTTARSNAALSTEEGDSQSNNSGDKAMTQDQYLNLCQLLQHVKIGSQGELVTSDNVIANCAGPFNEEATGSW